MRGDCYATHPAQKLSAWDQRQKNPLRRPPSVILPTAEVRLLKVIGILFDESSPIPRTNQEAELANDVGLLLPVKTAFRVDGKSALPLALPGQTILGGNFQLPDQIIVGSLVAVGMTDGTVYFKRAGRTVPGSVHIRQFESIGGLGESILIRIGGKEADIYGQIPVMQSVRRILGVFYDQI